MFNILCLINKEYQANMKSSDEYIEIDSIKQLNSNNIFQTYKQSQSFFNISPGEQNMGYLVAKSIKNKVINDYVYNCINYKFQSIIDLDNNNTEILGLLDKLDINLDLIIILEGSEYTIFDNKYKITKFKDFIEKLRAINSFTFKTQIIGNDFINTHEDIDDLFKYRILNSIDNCFGSVPTSNFKLNEAKEMAEWNVSKLNFKYINKIYKDWSNYDYRPANKYVDTITDIKPVIDFSSLSSWYDTPVKFRFTHNNKYMVIALLSGSIHCYERNNDNWIELSVSKPLGSLNVEGQRGLFSIFFDEKTFDLELNTTMYCLYQKKTNETDSNGFNVLSKVNYNSNTKTFEYVNDIWTGNFFCEAHQVTDGYISDDKIYIVVGDQFKYDFDYPQKPSTDVGKLLIMDLDGQNVRISATGIRNPLAITKLDKEIDNRERTIGVANGNSKSRIWFSSLKDPKYRYYLPPVYSLDKKSFNTNINMLHSPNKFYRFVNDWDNLYIYNNFTNELIWKAIKEDIDHDNENNSISFQDDNNIVILDSNGNPIWNTGTNQYNNIYFELNNSNLEIKEINNSNILWNTSTQRLDVINSSQIINMESENGIYTLKNGILFDKLENKIVYSFFNTTNENTDETLFQYQYQNDNNIVLYDKKNNYSVIWSLGAYPEFYGQPVKLSLANNGKILITDTETNLEIFETPSQKEYNIENYLPNYYTHNQGWTTDGFDNALTFTNTLDTNHESILKPNSVLKVFSIVDNSPSGITMYDSVSKHFKPQFLPRIINQYNALGFISFHGRYNQSSIDEYCETISIINIKNIGNIPVTDLDVMVIPTLGPVQSSTGPLDVTIDKFNGDLYFADVYKRKIYCIKFN